jgi:hypothetical protein
MIELQELRWSHQAIEAKEANNGLTFYVDWL